MKRFFFHDPYLLIYGFVIVFFGSYGQTFYIALFNEDIRNFYNLTDGQFGFVYAVATLVSSFLFINFAKLIDKIELKIDLSKILKDDKFKKTSFHFEIISIEEKIKFELTNEILDKNGFKTEKDIKDFLVSNIKTQYEKDIKQIKKKVGPYRSRNVKKSQIKRYFFFWMWGYPKTLTTPFKKTRAKKTFTVFFFLPGFFFCNLRILKLWCGWSGQHPRLFFCSPGFYSL